MWIAGSGIESKTYNVLFTIEYRLIELQRCSEQIMSRSWVITLPHYIPCCHDILLVAELKMAKACETAKAG